MIVLAAVSNERATRRLTHVITDESGAPLAAPALTTLTLTLYNVADLSVINGRDDTNILNANGGTLDSNGNLTLDLAPADMVILDGAQILERHRVLIEWTYAGGAKEKREVFEFTVANVEHVP